MEGEGRGFCAECSGWPHLGRAMRNSADTLGTVVQSKEQQVQRAQGGHVLVSKEPQGTGPGVLGCSRDRLNGAVLSATGKTWAFTVSLEDSRGSKCFRLSILKQKDSRKKPPSILNEFPRFLHPAYSHTNTSAEHPNAVPTGANTVAYTPCRSVLLWKFNNSRQETCCLCEFSTSRAELKDIISYSLIPSLTNFFVFASGQNQLTLARASG